MREEFDHADWDDVKNKLHQKYPILTTADLIWRDGSKTDLLRMIAIRLGMTTRELKQEIE